MAGECSGEGAKAPQGGKGQVGATRDRLFQLPNKFTDGRLEQLPAWLYDRTRIAEKRRVSFATWKHYTADSPLVPAGLLGPVRLEWRAIVLGKAP
jgi:hypothetical protein